MIVAANGCIIMILQLPNNLEHIDSALVRWNNVLYITSIKEAEDDSMEILISENVYNFFVIFLKSFSFLKKVASAVRSSRGSRTRDSSWWWQVVFAPYWSQCLVGAGRRQQLQCHYCGWGGIWSECYGQEGSQTMLPSEEWSTVKFARERIQRIINRGYKERKRERE